MAHKCALIVDDSKSARQFLSRILERYQMRIETARSAEEALEFLGRCRPDVIFMDHMMPGMDGLQAVRAIKTNPATATIPIMMYTSQAGELYVSQARALGAVGVLPKQIKPVEVEELLQSLHLVPVGDETEDDDASATAERAPAASNTAVDRALEPADWDDMHRWLEEMLRHHRRGLRSDIESTVTQLLDRHLPDEAWPARAEEARASQRRSSLTTVLILALAGLAAVFYWLHADTQKKWRDVVARNSQLMASLESRRADEAEDAAGVRQYLDSERANLLSQYDRFLAALEWAVNQSGGYGPGDVPLGDARLEVLTGLMERLNRVGFSGVVKVQVHRGRFCMTSGPDGRWRPAPANMPAAECERIGTSAGDGAFAADLQSVAFANFRADLQGPVKLEVEELGDAVPVTDYPATIQGASAGEWNRAAAINNRVQVRLLPDTELPLRGLPAASLR